MIVKISTCPTCGSDKIKLVKRNLTEDYQGTTYVVRDLEFYECPNCGERLYDREAMRRIEEVSPAYASKRKQAPKRKSRSTSQTSKHM